VGPGQAARAAARDLARPTPRRTGCATYSAPTTCTPTGSTGGCAPPERRRGARVLQADQDALRPRLRIYLIADNLSAHKTPAIRDWAADANTELVFTPTYASFLNRIECHFWAIGEFVINNAD
jgi:hypothetical protein